MDARAVVSARGLSRAYGDLVAVSSVDLDADSGEMLGIVGPDGAGKTTLLQMIAAILDPTSGECTVLGFDSQREASEITSRIGYMSQGFTLYDRLSVEENLRFSADVRGVVEDSYRARRERLLEMAGLARFADRPAGKLSGGMRKKLSLCTNLIHEPELLVLDEPGLGVDPLSRRQLWEMLETFRAQGVTVIVATSYMDEAERCDRIVLLQDGKTLARETPAGVRALARGRVYEVRSREVARAADELGRDPAVSGLQVLPDRVRFHLPEGGGALPSGAVAVEPTLEDVFVLHSPAEENEGLEREDAAGEEQKAGGLRIEGATVQFGRFRAVDRVTLEAEAGELLALLGPNGAGKTTLMRALCGLLPLAEGSAEVAGLALADAPFEIRQRVGYMSQRFSLYTDLTVAENLAFFTSAYGLRGRDAERAISWARRAARLEATDDVPVEEMSGAVRQRLALACSLLHRPAVLFLDEPTSGVDPVSRYGFWRLIRSLAAGGMTIVVSTHYLDEAAYCDRIGLMMQGRLIGHGTIDALRRETGSPADASIEDVFVRAVERAASREERAA